MIHGAAWGAAIDEPDMRANAAAGDRQARLAPTPAATPATKAMGVRALAMGLIIAHSRDRLEAEVGQPVVPRVDHDPGARDGRRGRRQR